jgi:hypothetical protein
VDKTFLNASAIGFAIVFAFNRVVFAADAIPTTGTISPVPDKWQYTLFDPVSADQLRGMDTDRPNTTNTPHTIDAGHLQIETGLFDYTYYRDRYQGANVRSDAYDFGQFNFRLGVLNNLEFNCVVESLDVLRNTDYVLGQSSTQSGFGDTIVGAKLNLFGNEGTDDVWATALAIQPQFKIPTARENLGNGHPELFVGVPFLINLPADFHLGLQTTVSWERNSTNNGDVTGLQNSVSVDRVFFQKFDIYLEYSAHVSNEHHHESQQTIDIGFTYPVTDNLMLDTGLNFGLNQATTNLEWLAGVSVRF